MIRVPIYSWDRTLFDKRLEDEREKLAEQVEPVLLCSTNPRFILSLRLVVVLHNLELIILLGGKESYEGAFLSGPWRELKIKFYLVNVCQACQAFSSAK